VPTHSLRLTEALSILAPCLKSSALSSALSAPRSGTCSWLDLQIWQSCRERPHQCLDGRFSASCCSRRSGGIPCLSCFKTRDSIFNCCPDGFRCWHPILGSFCARECPQRSHIPSHRPACGSRSAGDVVRPFGSARQLVVSRERSIGDARRAGPSRRWHRRHLAREIQRAINDPNVSPEDRRWAEFYAPKPRA